MLISASGLKKMLVGSLISEGMAQYSPRYPDTDSILDTLNNIFTEKICKHDSNKCCCISKLNDTVESFHKEIKKLKDTLECKRR